MKDADVLLARAQVGLAFIFAIGFLGILLVFIFHAPNLSPTAETAMTNMLVVFGTLLTLQMNYFFSRQRTSGLPDPTNTVTQTHTAADGSTMVIQSPAASTKVVAQPPLAQTQPKDTL